MSSQSLVIPTSAENAASAVSALTPILTAETNAVLAAISHIPSGGGQNVGGASIAQINASLATLQAAIIAALPKALPVDLSPLAAAIANEQSGINQILAAIASLTTLAQSEATQAALTAGLNALSAAITALGKVTPPAPAPVPNPGPVSTGVAAMIALLVPDANGNATLDIPAGSYAPFGTIRVGADGLTPLNDIKTLTLNGVPPLTDQAGNFITGTGTCVDGSLSRLKEGKAGILGMTLNLILNNIEVKNCGGTDDDGSAGFRNEAPVGYFPGEALLTVRKCWVHHNQNGILVANGTDAFPANVVLDGNLVEDNGLATNGLSHGAYIQGYDLKTLGGNVFRNNGNGWDLKVRCKTVTLLDDTINIGPSSGGFDLPDGAAGTATNFKLSLPANCASGNAIGWGEEPYFTNPGDFVFVSGVIDVQRAAGSYIYTGPSAGGIGNMIFKKAVQFPHGHPQLSGRATEAVLFDQ